MKKLLLSTLGVGLLGLIGYFLIISRAYPVAVVNEQAIGARDLNQNLEAALFSYENTLQAERQRGAEISDQRNDPQFILELKRATLNMMIEDVLIEQALTRMLGKAGLEARVAEKLGQANDVNQITQAVEALYGLSTDEFLRLVLVPAAWRQILVEELTKTSSGTFEAWLSLERAQASVSVVLSGLTWLNAQVAIQ